jgi:hypothetical protein
LEGVSPFGEIVLGASGAVILWMLFLGQQRRE